MPSCILTCYYRPKPGGFCKRLFRAIEALLARGHSVHYLAVVPFPIEHPNCHFHRFPWPANKTSGYLFWAIFHLLSPLLLLYLSFSCSVDRIFAFGHTYSLLFQPSRIIKRIPFALFLRADTVKNHQIKKRHFLLISIEYFLEGLGIVGTDMYGVSQTLTDAVQNRHSILVPKSAGLLRNEIPQLSYTKERDRWVVNYPSLQPVRGACVGVLEERKNQLFLLKVFEHIQAEQMQLFLYGTGPDEELLQHFVMKRNITDQVIFKGWVQAEQIWPEINLLLMPSQHEGAPNAVLEALATGTPVLASDIQEHREILPPICLLPLADE
ncbi:MAG: glycosyltransferase, partial [Candidatus Electrothrix sp. AUS4]|nr:glycosyltransferase [Candidatus Electrothrix sp. AUS4]